MNHIELREISKSYGTHTIINRLNLDIKEKDMFAITGKSGSGKTTLLNIMGLLETPDLGSIQICGVQNVKPNTGKSKKLLRNNIGYLFQNFALLENESINENLNIPLIYSKKSRVAKQELKRKALESVAISNPLSQKIHELSGGEQQRVSIARLLLKPCDIILADEPTGSLDQENRNRIIDLLKTINQSGKTIVIVTHDPYVVSQCNGYMNISSCS